MNQELINKLGAPFPFEAVDVKIQVTSKDKPVGMAVFYLDSRAIQNRLDEAVGPLNWSNHYTSWHDNSQICGISIYNEERSEWVTKHDGAENSDIEAVKGGLTDAFKRAAVLWGIGRYLYQIEGVWVDIEQRGKGSYIKDNQQAKLKAAYDAAVKKIFGSAANQQPVGGNTGTSAPNKPPQAVNTPPKNPPKQQPTAPSAPQNVSSEQPPAASQASKNEQKPTADPSNYDFKVHSIKPSGKASQLLELCDGKGEITSAYIKSGDQSITVGACLRNVQLEEKTSAYGKYSLIARYELAAA